MIQDINVLQGDDPVTECSSMGNSQLRARFSFNMPSRNNERMDMDDVINHHTSIDSYFVLQNIEQSLLQTESVTYEHGRIYCLFRQKIYPNISSNRVRELNRNVYLLIANGNTDTGDDQLCANRIKSVQDCKNTNDHRSYRQA